MSAPDYRLTLEDREAYLYALITGARDSYDVTMGAVTEIAAACKVRGTSKLLVEHQVSGRLTTLEVFKIASQLPDLFGGVFVGFVIRVATSTDNPEFLENVARNRGGQGRLFTDPAAADAWLRSL
ncbi:MAG TPA: hypothetical protein VKW04_17520 [Planctomycetota bacterium]|nr:hypothetical protein [Planctomycetota bacterium]